MTKTVIVTEALKAALQQKQERSVVVAVVPIEADVEEPQEDMPEAFEFAEVRLLTYEGDQQIPRRFPGTALRANASVVELHLWSYSCRPAQWATGLLGRQR